MRYWLLHIFCTVLSLPEFLKLYKLLSSLWWDKFLNLALRKSRFKTVDVTIRSFASCSCFSVRKNFSPYSECMHTARVKIYFTQSNKCRWNTELKRDFQVLLQTEPAKSIYPASANFHRSYWFTTVSLACATMRIAEVRWKHRLPFAVCGCGE
jgi:hypothetical protein